MADSLSFLQLVGDPQRWEILNLLASGDLRVGELTAKVGKAQNLVSYHLRELRDAGLVSARRSSADGRDTYYRLNVTELDALFEAARTDLHPSTPIRRGKPRVLFLCTGNSARSQMAEAFVTHRSVGRVHAESAGSHPKELHPLAVRVLAERGIDIAGNTTKHVDRFTGKRFDKIVTLCDKVREVCPEFPGDPLFAHWSMPDPSAADNYAAFVHARDEIEFRVAGLVTELIPQQKEAS